MIGHGALDPVISVEWSRKAYEALREAGADVVYRESPRWRTRSIRACFESCPPGSPRRSELGLRLATGAEMRVTGAVDGAAVVCVGGGQQREVAGTWSATLEWLVETLAPRVPQLGFAEVRYRVKSWRRLESCVEDARAAVYEIGAPRVALLGFSMGGAVAVTIAGEAQVEEVVGLAPWLPDELDVQPSAESGLRSSTARSTAGCPACPASRPRTPGRGSTAPASAEPKGATC